MYLGQRIILLGSGGSGKSTLARRLGERLNLPVVHLDTLFWQPGWVEPDRDEFDRRLIEWVGEERWIIDGNYTRTLDIRLSRADTVIFLDFSRWVCLYRVIKRRLMYHGKTRPDMTSGCPEQLDWAFLRWIWEYRRRTGAGVLERLASYQDPKQIIMLRTPAQVERFVRSLSPAPGHVSSCRISCYTNDSIRKEHHHETGH